MLAEGFFGLGFGKGEEVVYVDIFFVNLFIDISGVEECGEARGEVFKDFVGGLAFICFFFGFDSFPMLEDFVGVLNFYVAEDVGVAADKFFVNFVGDVTDGEVACFFSNLGVEEDMEEDIAEFFTHVGEVLTVYGVEELGVFFDEVFAEGFVGLFLVPGATARAAKFSNDIFEFL